MDRTSVWLKALPTLGIPLNTFHVYQDGYVLHVAGSQRRTLDIFMHLREFFPEPFEIDRGWSEMDHVAVFILSGTTPPEDLRGPHTFLNFLRSITEDHRDHRQDAAFTVESATKTLA